ncbi:MAG: hypothetical protein KDC54_03785, partial [Lewinella sp.]|nr:hypothetical protein [Lewinella sp.]
QIDDAYHVGEQQAEKDHLSESHNASITASRPGWVCRRAGISTKTAGKWAKEWAYWRKDSIYQKQNP